MLLTCLLLPTTWHRPSPRAPRLDQRNTLAGAFPTRPPVNHPRQHEAVVSLAPPVPEERTVACLRHGTPRLAGQEPAWILALQDTPQSIQTTSPIQANHRFFSDAATGRIIISPTDSDWARVALQVLMSHNSAPDCLIAEVRRGEAHVWQGAASRLELSRLSTFISSVAGGVTLSTSSSSTARSVMLSAPADRRNEPRP